VANEKLGPCARARRVMILQQLPMFFIWFVILFLLLRRGKRRDEIGDNCRWFAWLLVVGFSVCLLGWELPWSMGLGGKSTSRRCEGLHIPSDALSGVCLAASDALMLASIVLSCATFPLCGCGIAKLREQSLIILLPAITLGVVQNILVIATQPLDCLLHPAIAPLAPFPMSMWTVGWYAGRRISFGNNVMWMLAPSITLVLMQLPIWVKVGRRPPTRKVRIVNGKVRRHVAVVTPEEVKESFLPASSPVPSRPVDTYTEKTVFYASDVVAGQNREGFWMRTSSSLSSRSSSHASSAK